MMKITSYIFFVFINFVSIFIISGRYSNKKILISCGISAVIFTVLFLICGYIAGMLSLDWVYEDRKYLENYIIYLYFSILVTIMLGIGVTLARFLWKMLSSFHEKCNPKNVNKNPVKFVIQYETKIVLIYKILFFFAALMMFYGIWIGEEW